MEYHFLLARDLKFITDDNYETLNSAVIEVKRMLASLIVKIERERFVG